MNDTKNKWRRIIRLANASGDDRELAARSTAVLGAFGIFPTLALDGLPHREDPSVIPSLAARAREILPDLRALLRGLVPGATPAQRNYVQSLRAEHVKHIGSAENRAPNAVLSGEKIIGRMVVVPHEPKEGVRVYTFRFEGPDLGPTKRLPTAEYRDLLDPIFHRLIDGFEPVRVCGLAACGKFFLRSGRRVFCSAQCKWKYHQMSSEERRDYMYEYKARKLRRMCGSTAVRRMMEKVRRRKLSAARRRRLLAILRGVL